MARPKHHNPYDFVMSELVEATAFTARNIQLLRDGRRGPFEDEAVKIKAAQGVYDEDTVAHMAMIAGVHGAGLSLYASASIVGMFLDEHSAHPPARFSFLDGSYSFGHGVQHGEWFHVACDLRSMPEAGYMRGEPNDGDGVIYVADRQYVLEGKRNPRIRSTVPDGIDPKLPHPLCRIDDITKADTDVVFVTEEFEAGPDEDFRRAYEVYHSALRRSVGLLTVNLSLAIRNAFDRIQDRREAKGGPHFRERYVKGGS